MIDRHMAEITEANQKISTLKQECEECVRSWEGLRQDSDSLKIHYGTLKEEYEALATKKSEKEIEIRTIRRENDLAKDHTGNLRVTMTRLEGDIGHLENQMQEQYRDLESSIESLQKAIVKINRLTRERFEKTFHLVNEKFKVLFPKLFEGGKGELYLTDENDLLNSGVDILVQPPGKKLSHMALLSGGEKALAAVAFIFSIFLVKPSPFCVLDEVDAPLDDVNVKRFHQLIQEMTDRSQFIIITHNKQTMEIANALYGVTMQEPGVSKIVSVRMHEAPS